MNFYHGFRGLGVLFGSFFYMCVFSGTCVKGEGGREGRVSVTTLNSVTVHKSSQRQNVNDYWLGSNNT